MERVRLEVYECELLVRDSAARRVDAVIKSTAHGESRLRGRSGDQVDDDLMGDERLAAPILRDEGEQAVLDLVPLAGSRRQMTNGDGETDLVSLTALIEGPGGRPGQESRGTKG